VRLQKYLADCGVCSRRKAEELIAGGRVYVNEQIAEIGMSVDIAQDEVVLDGRYVKPASKRIWIMLNKPEGYITSAKDEFGRKTVLDLLHGVDERVFPVGRLDYDTSGLLLLTNDGELANKLVHPSYNVEKVYLVSVRRAPSAEALMALQNGIEMGGRTTRPARINIICKDGGLVKVEIAIKEGRNRIVRRMFAAVGHKVIALERLSLGGLTLGNIEKGSFRYLSETEIFGLTSTPS